MDFDNSAVERDYFEFEPDDLSPLKLLEHSVQHAALGPPAHSGVNGVPVSKPLGEPAPLASMLGDVEDCVDHLQVRKSDVPSLHGQGSGDLLILGLGNFHTSRVYLT